MRHAIRLTSLCAALMLAGCGDERAPRTVRVVLGPDQLFEYPTVGGIEDGAWLVRQAEHYAVSEIRRSEETDWVAVYTYRPAPDFRGTDRAEIEISLSMGGPTDPSNVTRITFLFHISDTAPQ